MGFFKNVKRTHFLVLLVLVSQLRSGRGVHHHDPTVTRTSWSYRYHGSRLALRVLHPEHEVRLLRQLDVGDRCRIVMTTTVLCRGGQYADVSCRRNGNAAIEDAVNPRSNSSGISDRLVQKSDVVVAERLHRWFSQRKRCVQPLGVLTERLVRRRKTTP